MAAQAEITGKRARRPAVTRTASGNHQPQAVLLVMAWLPSRSWRASEPCIAPPAAVLSIQTVFVKSGCTQIGKLYTGKVPRLWTDTITAHRAAVQDAVLDAAAALAAEHGPASVTMSQIAEQAGIGRATLYKYFPDVEAILIAWHQRHITRHLAQLTRSAADMSGTPASACRPCSRHSRPAWPTSACTAPSWPPWYIATSTWQAPSSSSWSSSPA
jgi:hypothetical protein